MGSPEAPLADEHQPPISALDLLRIPFNLRREKQIKARALELLAGSHLPGLMDLGGQQYLDVEYDETGCRISHELVRLGYGIEVSTFTDVQIIGDGVGEVEVSARRRDENHHGQPLSKANLYYKTGIGGRRNSLGPTKVIRILDIALAQKPDAL